MSEWKEYRLEELLDITSSKRIMRDEYTSNGIPFYRSKEIIELNSGNKISTELFISTKRFNDIKEKFGVPQEGDILLTSVGTLGIPYLVNETDHFYFKDGNLTWFKNFSHKINSKFLFYWFLSDIGKQSINYISIGSTQKALTIASLKKLTITLPPIEYQEKICSILSDIDTKITLNTQTNQTLEQIAQGIFKHWFIDFTPVHAKANALARGETIEQAELAAMACLSGKTVDKITALKTQDPTAYHQLQQTAQAFPSEFVESEMGLVPKGWEVKPLIEQFDFLGGSQPPKSEHIYEEKEGYIRFIQNRDYSNENHKTYIPISKKNKLCSETDILMDKYGEAGKVRFGISGAYNVALAKIEPKNILFKEFLRWYFMQEKTQAFLFAASLASTRSSLNSQTFIGMNIFIPTDNVLSAFNVIAEKYIQHSLNLKQENRTLSEVRDLLLTKLITGEIQL